MAGSNLLPAIRQVAEIHGKWLIQIQFVVFCKTIYSSSGHLFTDGSHTETRSSRYLFLLFYVSQTFLEAVYRDSPLTDMYRYARSFWTGIVFMQTFVQICLVYFLSMTLHVE